MVRVITAKGVTKTVTPLLDKTYNLILTYFNSTFRQTGTTPGEIMEHRETTIKIADIEIICQHRGKVKEEINMKLNTLSYILGTEDKIEAGKEYFFGQLWDGNGDGEELIESGAIAVYQDGEEYIVDFEVLETAEDILQTRVKVIGIN